MTIQMYRLAALAMAVLLPQAQAQTATETQLLNRIRELEQRLAAVESRLGEPPAVPAAVPTAAAQPEVSPTGDMTSQPGFASGTTFNVMVDGYYGFNFNRPTGRVNLLRYYDPLSNNFTVNAGGLVIERAPDVAKGRRFGVRLDLMFGQFTESLGTPANEPRPWVYRNIVQAYGTYIVPVGKGLTIDFGRFTSPLGSEGTYTKDQLLYSRSFWFAALPFYHTGIRTSYKLSDSTTFTWMLLNGMNQTEDFNGFKSHDFMLNTALTKSLSWTAQYYVGREGRDISPAALSNTPPAIPTQPGLSITPVTPRPDGRTHVADTYLTWTAAPKLTVVGQADYLNSRLYANSAPQRLFGMAAYAKYQVTDVFSLASRFEYMSDRGGWFSGTTQALKDISLSAALQPKPGFQVRWEYRQDRSNQPFFLTRTPGDLRKFQNTALMGLTWWFGGKQGSW